TALVSMQWANNETGVIFPVDLFSSMAHSVGALFHCDAVQAAGRNELNLANTDIDFLSLSAHKMHGPKGIGALFIRHGVPFAPLFHGGRRGRGRRAGTENPAAIVGFGVAAELASAALHLHMPRIAVLRDHLRFELLQRIPSSIALGNPDSILPNTLIIAFDSIESDAILLLLDRERIAASSGSAC